MDKLYDSTFKYVFQPGIVPLPFIEEICNCSTMAGTAFFKINGLSIIHKGKDGYKYGHDMLQSRLGKDAA